uniref:Uncharacterized protein n=1 Tax=Haemonchus contortus TaxID=6289 RepID=W6NFB8_HAECO
MGLRGSSRDLIQVRREFVSVPTIQPDAVSSHLSCLWAIQSGIRDRFGFLQGSCRLPHVKRYPGTARCPLSINSATNGWTSTGCGRPREKSVS